MDPYWDPCLLDVRFYLYLHRGKNLCFLRISVISRKILKARRRDVRDDLLPTTKDLNLHFSRQTFNLFFLISSDTFKGGYTDILTNFLFLDDNISNTIYISGHEMVITIVLCCSLSSAILKFLSLEIPSCLLSMVSGIESNPFRLCYT